MSRVAKNFIIAVVLGLLARVVSLLTTAYLAQTLGIGSFGSVGFAESTVGLLMLVADFGLQLSGVREVSRLRHDPEQLSDTVSNILSVQLVIMMAGFTLLNAFNWLLAPYDLQKKWLVTLYAAGMMFPYVSTIEWCLNGIERLSLSALGRLAREVLSLVLIFLLVHSASQISYIPLLQATATLVVAFWMVRYFIKATNTRLRLNIDVLRWLELLGQSWPLGVAVVFGQYLLRSGVIMLGFLSDDTQIGAFVAASRLIAYGYELMSVLIFAVLPVLTRLFVNDYTRFRGAVRKLRIFLMVLTITLTGAMLFIAPMLIEVIYGDEYRVSQELFKILVVAFGIALLSLSAYLPILAARQDKTVMYQNVIGAVVITVLNLLLIPHFGASGASLAFLLATMSSALFVIVSYWRINPKPDIGQASSQV